MKQGCYVIGRLGLGTRIPSFMCLCVFVSVRVCARATDSVAMKPSMMQGEGGREGGLNTLPCSMQARAMASC